MSHPVQITNCAFHNLTGVGVQIYNSKDVTFQGNTIFNPVEKGLDVQTSFNVIVNNNLIGNVGLGKSEESPHAAYAMCAVE